MLRGQFIVTARPQTTDDRGHDQILLVRRFAFSTWRFANNPYEERNGYCENSTVAVPVTSRSASSFSIQMSISHCFVSG
jgi:hypothetical protein